MSAEVCPHCGKLGRDHLCDAIALVQRPAPALDLRAIRERDKGYDPDDSWVAVADPDSVYAKDVARTHDQADADVHALLREVERLTAERDAYAAKYDTMAEAARLLAEREALAVRLAYVGPERRKADEPWSIPARVGSLVNTGSDAADWRIGMLPRIAITPNEWKHIAGRRRSDWEDAHGG